MKEPAAGAGPDAVVQRFLMARVPNRMSKKELDEKLGELLQFRYGEQKQAVWLVSPAIGFVDSPFPREVGDKILTLSDQSMSPRSKRKARRRNGNRSHREPLTMRARLLCRRHETVIVQF